MVTLRPYARRKTVVSEHYVPIYPPLCSPSYKHVQYLSWETVSQKLNIFQVAFKCWSFLWFRNHLHQLRTIYRKRNLKCLKFLIHSITQTRASISEWRGERHVLTFLAPNKPSSPSNVLNHPCPEKKSLSFQEPYVKHHLFVVPKSGLTCTSHVNLWSLITYASANSVDSTSANRSVSLGSTSMLLNTLLFRPFQMYHNIQAKWWSSIFIHLSMWQYDLFY